MKKQTASGLFLAMFLRAAVIILGILIVIFTIFFLTQIIKNSASENNKTTVSDNVLTEAEAHDDFLYNTTEATEVAPAGDGAADNTTEPAGTSYDKQIVVLNSTDITGLAGRWCDKLNTYGYNDTVASDFSTLQSATKIIAKVDGDGQDLLQYFNGATYEVGTVTEGTTAPVEKADIVIILGTADNDQ